jgi:hypothetical protein
VQKVIHGVFNGASRQYGQKLHGYDASDAITRQFLGGTCGQACSRHDASMAAEVKRRAPGRCEIAGCVTPERMGDCGSTERARCDMSWREKRKQRDRSPDQAQPQRSCLFRSLLTGIGESHPGMLSCRYYAEYAAATSILPVSHRSHRDLPSLDDVSLSAARYDAALSSVSSPGLRRSSYLSTSSPL